MAGHMVIRASLGSRVTAGALKTATGWVIVLSPSIEAGSDRERRVIAKTSLAIERAEVCAAPLGGVDIIAPGVAMGVAV